MKFLKLLDEFCEIHGFECLEAMIGNSHFLIDEVELVGNIRGIRYCNLKDG